MLFMSLIVVIKLYFRNSRMSSPEVERFEITEEDLNPFPKRKRMSKNKAALGETCSIWQMEGLKNDIMSCTIHCVQWIFLCGKMLTCDKTVLQFKNCILQKCL